jgi:ADP-ribosylglycohydrolase
MSRREQTERSALWAAWGDAVGYITEFAPDTKAVRQRVGDTKVVATKPWTRRLGGQYGIDASLPAGCYSDDTQLRLATGRSIRADGRFDVRGFAKVELVVWQAYALGGGRSTRAAAANLVQKSRDWLSNFYAVGSVRYHDAGGNGAAMRIQPHVWAARDLSKPTTYLGDVLRNTITTHGHPMAMVGAALHAVMLARTLETAHVPSPDKWLALFDGLEILPSIIHEDEELHAFWAPAWQDIGKTSIDRAINAALSEARLELDVIRRLADTDARTAYEEMVLATRATNETTRGSATKTAFLAMALAWLRREQPAEGLLEAANVLRSDTDSIASMAGAILGAVAGSDPPSLVLDAEYISREANRLTAIAEDRGAESFGYPDPARWKAPTATLDLVGKVGDRLGLAGLGLLSANGREWQDHGRSPATWHWGHLDFGQSVLIKRRPTPGPLDRSMIGRLYYSGTPPLETPESRNSVEQLLPFKGADEPAVATSEVNQASTVTRDGTWLEAPTVDDAFEDVRKHDFDSAVVGRHFLNFAARPNDGHSLAMAFSAMVAKAWGTRRSKR